MEYFVDAFKKFADFSGRASRKEYWMYSLFYFIFYVVLMIIDAVLGSAVLSSIFALVMLIPSISIATRRLHDTGRSGWWQLIVLLPLVGLIVLIVFLAQDSAEENQYGVSPKVA